MAEKLELEDFSGGITDYYLSAPPNKMKECDNLLINQYQNQGKVFTRPGSELYDKTAARPVANRISTCFEYKGKLYVQSADRLYYYTSQIVSSGSFVVGQYYEITELGTTNFQLIGAEKNKIGTIFKATGVGAGTGKARKGTWQEIPGQAGNNAFPLSAPEHQFTYDHWNNHTIMANSTLPGYPMKVYQVGDEIKLTQAGLPKLDSSLVSITGDGGTARTYLYKFVYRREYTSGPHPEVTINATNMVKDKLYKIQTVGTTDYTLYGSNSLIVGTYFIATGPGTGDGTVTQTDSDFFLDLGAPSNPVKFTSTAAIGPSMGAAIANYAKIVTPAINIIAGERYEIRTLGTTDFTLLGAPSNTLGTKFFATVNGTGTSGTGDAYRLINTKETNYNEEEIKIDIYRTANNGTTYYLVKTVDFTSTGYTDNLIDADLLTKEQLYTNGGVVANDAPPKCRSIHVRNDIAYYGGILGQSYRMLQSIVGDFDSVPETFYVDVDDEIVAISSTKNNVIILCKEKVYRVDGVFDDLGRGGMVVERISDTAGCIGVNTPVQALDGVLWLGKDAVYFTDGFKVMKLNQDYDKTYKTFADNDLNNAKYQGKYDNKKNRVWWTIQEDGSSIINKCYVLDLNWGIRPDATFTTISGNSFRPTAIEFVNGDMIRCDLIGYVFVHRDTLFVDPKINDSETNVTKWLDEVIVYNMETSSYNFGTSAVRKYVTQANVTCESTTNLALQIVSNNDDNRIVSNLLPIRYRGNIVWGEPDVYWGDISLEWNRQGLIHEKRLMPAKNLRCNYKALKFTNAHVAILSSDTIGTAIINPSLKTATLSNTIYDWPDKAIGYFISFAEDGYIKEYEITGRSPDILTFSDVLNSVGSGTQKWVIRGRPLGEVLNLLNVSVIYDIAGPSQTAFKVSTSGEVQ